MGVRCSAQTLFDSLELWSTGSQLRCANDVASCAADLSTRSSRSGLRCAAEKGLRSSIATLKDSSTNWSCYGIKNFTDGSPKLEVARSRRTEASQPPGSEARRLAAWRAARRIGRSQMQLQWPIFRKLERWV